MINFLIALLIALGFWSRASKQIEAKTRNSSWWRVGVLLVITAFVAVFYWKTNEIATIKSHLHVGLVRGSIYKDSVMLSDTIWVDSVIDNHKVKYETIATRMIVNDTLPRDSVVLTYIYRFDKLNHFRQGWEALGKQDSIDWEIEKYGGLRLEIGVRNDSISTARTFDKEYNDFFISQGVGDDHCKYYTRYIATRIPSLFLFQPEIESRTIPQTNGQAEFLSLRNYAKTKEMSEDVTNYYGQDGVVYHTFDWFKNCYERSAGSWNGISRRFSCLGINSMNFFTAADLTQLTIENQIESQCPIAQYIMQFDIPVEFLPVRYKISEQSPYSFVIFDKPSLNQLNNGIRTFHVKFPTMQNLQLIRSLILTTILTALVSLLSTNLYFRLRKHYLKYRKNHRLTYRQAKVFWRKWVRLYTRVAIAVTMIFVLYWGFCVMFNSRLYIYSQHYWQTLYFMGGLVLATIILSTIIMYFDIKKKKK